MILYQGVLYLPAKFLGHISTFFYYRLKKGQIIQIMQFRVQRSSQNCYLTPKKCSQGHEIFFGHQQQSLKGILALGSYVPAITWQCPRPKDDFRSHFFPFFYFRTEFWALKVLQFG